MRLTGSVRLDARVGAVRKQRQEGGHETAVLQLLEERPEVRAELTDRLAVGPPDAGVRVLGCADDEVHELRRRLDQHLLASLCCLGERQEARLPARGGRDGRSHRE